MRLARNMAAGMANSALVVLINLVALPFYLRFLGMEAYGLIGFYATLQTVLQVLDMGLGPTISREVAHDAETGRRRRSASLLRTLGLVYAGVAVVIALAVALAAPWLGAHWLHAQHLPEAAIAQAVALMGVNLACRWPISLYHGALVGSHRLALSSLTSMAMNLAAACTAIGVLAWGPRSIQAFFVVQAVFGLLHASVLRLVARRVVGERDAPFDFVALRRVWRFSAWMGGIGITSLVFTQLDKALLSRLIDLDSFGHYMLAVLLASGLQVVLGPAFNVIYPKFTTLIARGDQSALARFYADMSRMIAAAVFSLALALILHTEALVTLWTGRADIAGRVAPLVMLLATGSALSGVMYLPYALQLASGRPRIAFAINVVLLLVATPIIAWLAIHRGAMGGALSWALLGATHMTVCTIVTGRRIAPFAGIQWLARDIGVPAVLAVLPALAGAWICHLVGASPWAEVAIAASAACIGMVAGGAYSPFARQQLLATIGGWTGRAPFESQR